MGEVSYQALPLLRFFAYKIRAREKVRKGEGEPGDEATFMLACILLHERYRMLALRSRSITSSFRLFNMITRHEAMQALVTHK